MSLWKTAVVKLRDCKIKRRKKKTRVCVCVCVRVVCVRVCACVRARNRVHYSNGIYANDKNDTARVILSMYLINSHYIQVF